MAKTVHLTCWLLFIGYHSDINLEEVLLHVQLLSVPGSVGTLWPLTKRGRAGMGRALLLGRRASPGKQRSSAGPSWPGQGFRHAFLEEGWGVVTRRWKAASGWTEVGELVVGTGSSSSKPLKVPLCPSSAAGSRPHRLLSPLWGPPKLRLGLHPERCVPVPP